MEILKKEQWPEYEEFCSHSPQSCFTQSTMWPDVKANWESKIVVSRNASGKIVGGMLVLIQKIPLIGTSFLYAPRGPVCDLNDKKVLADLFAGADILAKKYKAHVFKCDPDVLVSNTEFLSTMRKMGFVRRYGPTGFEGIQVRFNYRLYLHGRTEDQVLMDLTQKTRYNIRVAMKHGVEIKVVGKEYLDEFTRLMSVTGERDSFNIRPKEYFARMLDALGEHIRLYMGFYDGQAVCGTITTNYGGKCCYVYGASDNAFRNVMPNYLIQWEMIRWAVETGCTVYDFMGISGDTENEDDHLYGLYRFKRGFNGCVDELPGEFDRVYRPLAAKLVKHAVRLNAVLRKLKKKVQK